MSGNPPAKKRRIVKKLDFENCVVTNIRTKARTKRKLRAKLTREVENLEESPQRGDRDSSTSSPVLTQRPQTRRQTSPVLMRTPTQRRKSPVLLSKRKLDFASEDTAQTSRKLNTETSSLRKSPVFNVKTSKWKSGNATTTTITTTTTTPTSQKEREQATSRRTSGSDTETSYQIDDFTQDSKPSVEISSVESQQDVRSTSSWRHCSLDAIGESLEISPDVTCPRFVCDCPEGTAYSKGIVRKIFKKNSLLGRLEKLGRKQASEKLLWQHQRQRKIVTTLKKLTVITSWNEDSSFILKCQSVSPDSPDEVNFLFISSQWVPSVKRIQRGSVLRLYPPWQKVSVAGLGADVLLNVICMEILGEEDKMAAAAAAAAADKIRFESLPLDEYETNQKLFVDSLFSSCTSPFLY